MKKLIYEKLEKLRKSLTGVGEFLDQTCQSFVRELCPLSQFAE